MHKTKISLLLLLWHAALLAEPARPAAAGATGPSLRQPLSVDDPMLAPAPPPKRVLSSFREALAQLRARSTDLRIALDQVREAEAETRIALARYLPSIQANGWYRHELLTRTNPGAVPVVTGDRVVTSSIVPIPNTYAGSVEVDQTIVDVQALDRIGIGELGEQASRLSVEDKQRAIVLSVANQIVAVVAAERSAEINRVGLRVALEQLELAKRSRTLGAATALDVVRAEENAANARAALVAGDEFLRDARESLGLSLGNAEETGVAPDVSVDAVADEAVAACRAVASVGDRPEVAAARVNLEMAKRNLRNVWYGSLPTVRARSTLGATSVVPTGYPNPTWSIEGLLSIPIWDGGERYGNMRKARAAEDIAAQKLQALERQGILQVEQARRRLVSAELSVKVAREQRELAAKNEELTQSAYLAGQGTSLELVTASEAHRRAELNLALREFGVVRARLLASLALATCFP